MLTDLTHNKIISDTITDEFIENVNSVLVPMVEGVFGESAIALQMYEDYLSDGFKLDGRWCYPFTVLTDNGARTLWVSWTVDKKHFAGGVPYSYTGKAPMDFTLMHSVPSELSDKLVGRNTYATSDGYLKVRLQTVSEDPLFLSGKYSQTFIDEMAKQLTDAISVAMSVSGLNTSCLSLQMLFTPETYMEHTSENVTYRRLRLTDRASAPRDFWIKWTRTNSATAYSVSDSPTPGTVCFELGEDVPQKVREREYRFLLGTDADKYQSSMSRKSITEWRELIKRAVKRGELERIELDGFGTDGAAESDDILNAMLADVVLDKRVTADEIPETNGDDALQNALKSILEDPTLADVDDESDAPDGEMTDDSESADDADVPPFDCDAEDGGDEPPFDCDKDEAEDTAESDDGAFAEDEGIAEISNDIADVKNALKIEENKENDDKTPLADEMKEKMIRAEIEAKVRLEYESVARMKAEEEARKLQEEKERLRRENERLVAEAKRAEEARAREEAARKEREDRLKAEIEAKVRAEAREKERLAEAAMLAIEEKRRLEAEKAEQMRLAAERERLKEAERRAQEERLRVEEERRAEAERIRREAEALAAAQREAQISDASADKKPKYTFISKRATFFFRNHIDPNITDAMEEIIRKTLEKLSKTDVPINIKASVVDEMTVCLDFVRIPAEEEELLIKIIQALGNGNIGIAKAKVEQ